MSDNSNAMSGVGFLGMLFAGFISYVMNGFLWSLLHCLFGWFYIIYVVIFRHSEIVPAFVKFFS